MNGKFSFRKLFLTLIKCDGLFIKCIIVTESQKQMDSPRMNEIVRNALRARFSDFDFGRPPTNGIFLRPFKRFPIDRMKSRLVDVVFSTMAGCDVLDAAGVIELRFGFLLDEKSMVVVVVVDGAVVTEAAAVVAVVTVVVAVSVPVIVVDDACDCCAKIVARAHMLASMVHMRRLASANRRSILDCCVCAALTIVVTGRSTDFSLTFTVVLYLFRASAGGDTAIA